CAALTATAIEETHRGRLDAAYALVAESERALWMIRGRAGYAVWRVVRVLIQASAWDVADQFVASRAEASAQELVLALLKSGELERARRVIDRLNPGERVVMLVEWAARSPPEFRAGRFAEAVEEYESVVDDADRVDALRAFARFVSLDDP